MENKFYVYSHYKKTTGECFYIGKGTGNRYKSISGRNNHWKNIVNKYGFETLILVNNISEEKAFKLEANFCKQIGYNNLCNLHEEDGWGGHTPTNETKEKMYTPQRNQNVSNSLKGYKQSEEHILKRSSHLKGKSNLKNKKPKPKGFGENVSIKLKGKSKPYLQKIVLQYNLQGEFIKEWSSITEICTQLFNDTSKNPNITKCCQSKIKTAYGYIWKFKNLI
jgi:hypothetical protein